MTDLELVKACAEAMGFQYELNTDKAEYYDAVCLYDEGCNMWNKTYNPLWNDAEAMALVKKFRMHITGGYTYSDMAMFPWQVEINNGEDQAWQAKNADLNRAVVECVAKIHAAR